MADGVWKWVQSYVIWGSDQLSLHKFFAPSTPSMRKGRDGEKKKKENKLSWEGHTRNPSWVGQIKMLFRLVKMGTDIIGATGIKGRDRHNRWGQTYDQIS